MSPLPDEAIASCVARVAIFRGLDAPQREDIARFGRRVELASGGRLYGVGDHVSDLFVVHSGRVRMVRILAPGKEQLIRMAGPGETVGEYPFLTGRPPLAWVFAVEPTILCVFPHQALAPLVTHYPAIALRLLSALAERLGDAERRFAEQAGVDVPTRVAEYLLSLPPGSGTQSAVVQLPMAKKDLASYLGTTPESLSRALTRLQRHGLIEVQTRGRIMVRDRSGLDAGQGDRVPQSPS